MTAADRTVSADDAQPAALTRQAALGLALAGAIIGGWLVVHVLAVWVYDPMRDPLILAPLAIAMQTWLSVGLFIVAHDCMHGSLAPGRRWVNRWTGRLALALYAGLWYDRLVPKHFAHHRAPGTGEDPDYDPDHPRTFWPWFGRFMREYFSWRDFAILTAALAAYLLLLGAPLSNTMLFWAVPGWLSAIQIFYFGTYLPHREEEAGFSDAHRARSNDFPWLVSLLTCFHFGYHHEHHCRPRVPWWQLPRLRAGEGAAHAALTKDS